MKISSMHFKVTPRTHPLLIGLVAAHGLTDLRHPESLLPYFVCLVPLPGLVVTLAFVVTSLVHFSLDIGLEDSLRLHVSWVVVGASLGIDAAADVALAFMALVHLPLHLLRVWREGTLASRACVVAAVVGGAMVAAWLASWSPPRLTLSDLHQKVVVAHVLAAMLMHSSRIKG